MLNELDHFLNTGPSGIVEYDGVLGLNNRIGEWLGTPQYTVADDPDWGHNLRPYWFEPNNKRLGMQLEMAIVRKLPRDVRDVTIRRIGVDFPEVDVCIIEIVHHLGIFRGRVRIGEGGVSNVIF